MSMGQRTPGPQNMWVRFRNNSTAFYLGTGVTGLELEEEQFKIPVMNDLSGRNTPFQVVQDGAEEAFGVVLNRFDYNVVMAMRALQAGVPAAVPPPAAVLGSENGIARGTLVIGISDFEFIYTNAYAGTPSAGQFIGGVSDLTSGRRYFSATIAKYKESTVGTRVLEVAFALRCYNVFAPTTRGFSLYVEGANLGALAPLA